MNFAFDLYVDRPSWLHRLDPRTKLAFVVFSSVVLLSFGHLFVPAAFLLVVHGVLHLLGYDDQEEADARRMREREEAILRLLR